MYHPTVPPYCPPDEVYLLCVASMALGLALAPLLTVTLKMVFGPTYPTVYP